MSFTVFSYRFNKHHQFETIFRQLRFIEIRKRWQIPTKILRIFVFFKEVVSNCHNSTNIGYKPRIQLSEICIMAADSGKEGGWDG